LQHTRRCRIRSRTRGAAAALPSAVLQAPWRRTPGRRSSCPQPGSWGGRHAVPALPGTLQDLHGLSTRPNHSTRRLRSCPRRIGWHSRRAPSAVARLVTLYSQFHPSQYPMACHRTAPQRRAGCRRPWPHRGIDRLAGRRRAYQVGPLVSTPRWTCSSCCPSSRPAEQHHAAPDRIVAHQPVVEAWPALPRSPSATMRRPPDPTPRSHRRESVAVAVVVA